METAAGEKVESLLQRVKRLKLGQNAVIPAHYYQSDEVKFAADFIGDSLELSKLCLESTADTIVFAGVRFMAETAKILSPRKRVLLPSLEAGCSLADSLTAGQVRMLKERHPKAAVVTYINTSAEVKAESDACCTSANYLKILKALPEEQILFLPDKFMAANAKRQLENEGLRKEIIGWDGECIVHNQFTPGQMREAKAANPGLSFLVHIECPPSTVDYADFAGSTAGMVRYVEAHKEKRDFFVLTECGMLGDLERKFPDRKFMTPCTICPHMKKITLENVAASLETGTHEITVPEPVRLRAKRALDRMLELGG